MIKIGEYNRLTVKKVVDFGVYLDGEERDEILMPNEYVPDKCYPGDDVTVFIYFDSEDRIIATTEKPNIVVGEFAYMKVVDTTSVGAFLDWGLRKDLLVPFKEQLTPMEVGQSYIVYAYVDKKTDRIVASSKIDHFLDQIPADYVIGQEVDILVAAKTDLGYKVIVNNMHWGLIYNTEIFQTIKIGQKLKAYIKNIREDEKIDLLLQKRGYDVIDDLSKVILAKLYDFGGVLDVSDKSDPEIIYRLFSCSKKNFKKALGLLFKQGMIDIKPNEVTLSDRR